MWVRVTKETDYKTEEWINLNQVYNIQINSDEFIIYFFIDGRDLEYHFEENIEDFIAIKNALMGIGVTYQKTNSGMIEVGNNVRGE